MPVVGGLDIHRKQLTFDYLDTVTGEVKRGQITPADRKPKASGPPASIRAGHRPSASAQVCSDPGALRYFRTVRD